MVRQMNNAYDVENLCQAYEQLRPYVAKDLAKLKEKNVRYIVVVFLRFKTSGVEMFIVL